MSLITIEKNIPMPTRRKPKYPWDEMDVGDSFLFPTKVKPTTAASISYMAGKQHHKKFSIRLMTEGIRCWRTD